MGTETDGRVQKMRLGEVESFLREHEDPCVTATEVAEHFNVTPKAARYRLKQLEDSKRACGKTIGASATAWYPLY